MMDMRRETLENKCLEAAERHLKYVLSDPNLNLKSRSYKIDEVHEFYSRVFGNLGMSGVLKKWHEAVEKELMQYHLEGEEDEYLVRELFSLLKVKENTAIFKALEYSGAKIQQREEEGIKDFFVDAKNVQKVVDYLGSINAIRIEELVK